MSIRQELLQEIESTPEHLLTDVINFVRLVKNVDIEYLQANFVSSSEFLKKLETVGSWQGDDLEECFHRVTGDRLPAQF